MVVDALAGLFHALFFSYACVLLLALRFSQLIALLIEIVQDDVEFVSSPLLLEEVLF